MPIVEFNPHIMPNPELVIWRYMEIWKFKKLLKKKALFFCRTDRFSDSFEGSIPKKEVEYRIIEQTRNMTREKGKIEISDVKENITTLSKTHKEMNYNVLANCWHINNSENDLMWRLYLKSNDGVAIKSTVSNLHKSFINTREKLICSKIRYLDYDKDIWYHETEFPYRSYNLYTPLIHKRIEFKGEEELRLLYDSNKDVSELSSSDCGKNIIINVEDLIDSVWCHPTSDKIQQQQVKDIIKKYGFELRVEQSSLSSKPYY